MNKGSRDPARVEAAGRSAGPPQARPGPSEGNAAHELARVGASASWPYPRWIAHRGAGRLAPENTLASFRLGASHGYRMFECDVKLSADGVPFLLHDTTLERTTNGTGVAGEQPWDALSRLDAGSWHSPAFAGEALPTFDSIARYCLDNSYFLNIEIKPTPGVDGRTGTVVANEAARLWHNTAVPPLLTSFQPAALEAARAAQPGLPRGLLLDELPENWLETAAKLQCVAIVCNQKLWNADTVAQAQKAGFRTLSYTVNDETSAKRLIDLGTDGIITDRVDAFRPDS
jgi:glycerophosphoryl diester phosphodiesterase